MADISRYVDKARVDWELRDLAELPIDDLQDVRKADAEAIQKALNVRTTRQLAEHRLVRAA